MLAPETKAEICRLFYAEHYTMNAIAETLGVHHDTVQSVINLRGRKHVSVAVRESLVTPYRQIIEERLAKTPTLRSTRLMQILRDYGFKGSLTTLRLTVAQMRPKQKRAFATLSFFPGEAAQVDWASFGKMRVGRAERALSCFVMTLCHSRATYAVFTFDQTLESFLRSHIRAFRYLGGVARILYYDNLRSAVIDRQGTAIRFHPILLEMAGQYCFQPRACNVRSGWEKGRVERTIRYLRDNFFPAREFRDIDDANHQLWSWLDEVGNVRPWPDDRSKSVKQVWDEEKARLIATGANDFQTDDVGPCRPSKMCYVRYDTNDYSVPFRYVGEILTLIASEDEIRIIDGQQEVARHVRSYSKGEKIKADEHFLGMYEHKPAAASNCRRSGLISAVPEAEKLYELMLDAGISTGLQTTKLFKLLEIYGKSVFASAVREAVDLGLPRASAVAQILERRDRRRTEPLPLPVILPDRPDIARATVNPHALATYDAVATPVGEGSHDVG